MMSKLVSYLKGLTRPVTDAYPELKNAVTWDEHVAVGLRLELKSCPICKSDFRDHRYASIGSIRIGNRHSQVEPFWDAVKQHEWETVQKYRTGEHSPDNAEACVIECSSDGMAVLFVHTPFEPCEYDSIDFCEVLNSKECSTLAEQLTGKWKALGVPKTLSEG